MIIATEEFQKEKRRGVSLYLLFSGVAFLILAFSTVSATAQTVTVVSNTGQTDSTTETNLIDEEQQAQGFTTGTTPYNLTTVGFNIRNAAPDTADTFTVSIQGVSGANPDGIDLASQEVTTESTTGTTTVDFTSANIVLKPSTTYFVVFTYDGDAADTVALQTTDADAEDVGGQPGVTINNTFHHYTSNAWTTVDRAIEIAVSGGAGPIAYLASVSDTGPSAHDNHTHDNSPTIALSGFTGTVTLTVSADSETDVTATHTGDGEVLIQPLTVNKSWTITAVDSASPTANTVSFEIYIGNLLVGNTHSHRGGGIGLGFSAAYAARAQRFRTTAAGPYSLERIRYGVSRATSSDANLTISVQRTAFNGSPDGTKLVTINVDNNDTKTTGSKTVTLVDPLDLAANTNYFIVFETSQNLGLGTPTADEDPVGTSLTGWELAGNAWFAVWGNWTNRNSDSKIFLSLEGSLDLQWSTDLHVDSDAGSSNADHITNDTTPTITVAGFDPSVSVTVTARHSTASSRTATLTGNGDVDLPVLGEGVWTISASDGTNTSSDRSITIDTTNPTITNVSDIGTTPDTTPDLTFTTSEAGSLVENTACGIVAQDVTAGRQTITLTVLNSALYDSCTLQMTDIAGNTSAVTDVPDFTITAPSEITLHNDSGAGDNVNTGSYTPDNLTSDTTPKVTLRNFVGNVSITAVHDTASDVTVSALSNGDYTFTTALAEGKWSITGTDSATTPNTATLTITVLPKLVTSTSVAHNDQGSVAVGSVSSSTIFRRVTQSFTTGDDLFRLREVHFKIASVTNLIFSDNFEVELLAANNLSPPRPGSRVTTDTCDIFNGIPISSLVAGEYVLEVPEDKVCKLQPNTQYFLVFQIRPGGSSIPVIALTTTSNDSDDGRTGWTLEDECLKTQGAGQYGATGTWSACDHDRVLKLGLFGTEEAQVDLKASSDLGSSSTDNLTKDATPTIVTRGFEQGTVTNIVAARDGGGATDVTATISTGNGEVDLGTLADGVWTITATQGLLTASIPITVDATAPTLSAPSSIGPTADTTPDLTFTTDEAGSLTLGGSCATTTTSATSGTNTITLDALTTATYSDCTITVTDTAGNASSPLAIPSFSVVSGTITISMVATSATSREATATTSGVATNRNWVLFDPGTGTPTCGGTTSNLDFSGAATYTSGTAVTVTSSESDNGKKVCFRATIGGVIFYQASDAIAGVDTTAPVLSSPSSIGPTADTTPDVSFATTEAGSLTLGGSCATTTTSATSGTNTITLDALTPATYSDCTITVTDTAGNASNVLAIPSFSIVSGSIAITMAATPAQSRSATATVSATATNRSWVLFDPGATTPPTCGGTTSNLDFSGATTYTSGTAVTVTSSEADNGKKVCFRATISGVTFYQATDAIAGVDTTAPSAPTGLDLDSDDDTGSSNSDNRTNKTSGLSIAVAAAGENGGTVQLYRAGTTAVGSATTITAGAVSIDISLAQGTHSITAKTTDVAGNVSVASDTLAITVDTTAPTLSAPSSIGPTADTTPDLTFTTTEGGSLTIGGSCATTTTSVTTGTKTITLSALSPATYSNCTITVTDTAGNASNVLAIPSFSVVSASISISMATTLAQSRSATATVSGTATNRNWVLFDPGTGTPTCGGTTSNLDFTGATAYTSGTAVTVTSSESDNGKKVCFRATIGGVTFYQASDAIAGVDTTAPTAPTALDLAAADDTGASQTDNRTNKTSGLSIAVAAAGENGGTVQLYRAGTTAVGSATTIAAGTVSIDISLTQGTHSITAKTTDVAGNVSVASSALTIIVDTTIPTVALTNSIFTNALSTTDTHINTAEATANQAIITAPTGSDTGGAYTFAYTTVASSETCDGDLTYSATIPVAGFSGSDGTYKVCVRVTDVASNIQYTATPTFTKDTTAPSAPTTPDLHSDDDTGSSNSDNITSQTSGLSIAVAAAGENGGTVQLYNGSTPVGSATTISSGSATINISLTQGTHTITAKTTDTANAESPASAALTIVVDTTNPVAKLTFETVKSRGSATAYDTSTTRFLTTGERLMINDASTDTSGSGIDNSSRTLSETAIGTTEQHTADNANTVTISGTAGTWPYVLTNLNGVLKYTYTVSDEAGNTHTITNTLSNLFFDTTDPATPVIDLTTDTGSSNSDNITNNNTPTISITNDAQRVKGTDGVAIDNDNGKSTEVIEWHLTSAGGSTFTKQSQTTNTFTPATALSDGVYKIKAAFVDQAGNEAESAVITFTIDTTAPTKPTGLDLDSADDTGRSNSDNVTKTTTGLTFTATATGENGGTVQFYKGPSVLGSSATITSGSASVSVPLNLGTHAITAKTTDKAGNVSAASTALSVTVDTTAPTAPSPDMTTATDSGLSDTDNITNDKTPDFTFTPANGTNDLGRYKVHFVANSSLNTTCPTKSASTDTLTNLANANAVTATPSADLSDGKYCVYVEQADLAGNRGVSSGLAIYIDTTLPSIAAITGDLLDAFDSTRLEVAADEESDSDALWNPGKTDDITKESSVSIQVAAIPIETIMGARRDGEIILESVNVATSAKQTKTFRIQSPTTNAVSHTFTGVTVGQGSVVYAGNNNTISVKYKDVAGNEIATARLIRTVVGDFKTKTPETPDLDVGSDSGTSDTDNYTNAEYLDITVEDDNADSDREYPTIVRLYSWIDDSSADGAVQASELTVLQKETSPEDETANLAAVDWLIKGSNSGKDVTFENIVLAEGTHKIVAGQIDKAGNAQAYSAPLTIYVDRTVPTAPVAATLNSADDSGAVRPGAQTAEINVYRVDGITKVASDLSFFGCVDPSDIRTSGGTDVAIVTAVVRDDDDAVVTDTGTANTGNSGASVKFADTLVDSTTALVRPTTCPDGLYPYTLDLDETYGTANRSETYTVSMTAIDLAGNISEEGAATTIVIDQLKPSDVLGVLTLNALTDNGDDDSDNATSFTDLLFHTNAHSLDDNGATAYQSLLQKTLSHYEVVLQQYKDGATVGNIFPAPVGEQITYFQGTTIPAQTINSATNIPETTLTGNGIAVLLKGLNLSFERYTQVFQTRLRAVDVAGNWQDLSPTFSVSYLLPPPPMTAAALATTSDSSSGVDGTDADGITNATMWNVTGAFTYRERDSSPLINVVKARVVKVADGSVIASADITNISHGSIEGTCADEADTCSETDDTDSTFTHTFDFTSENLADGDYRVEFRTYNGSETGAVNSGDDELIVTYDSAPPLTSALQDLGLNAIIHNSNLNSVIFKAVKPQKGALNVYAVGGTEPLQTETEDRVSSRIDFENAVFRLNFDYAFTITDAAGNESDRVVLPQMPDIRIVRLGDTTPARYAAVALTHEDATEYPHVENGVSVTFGFINHTSSYACPEADDVLYDAYTSGAAVTSQGNQQACFRYGHTLEGVDMAIYKGSVGAPDFASITLNVDDDTTISSITRSNNAFTQATRPRIDGSSLPSTPVRIYRVTEAQFDGATSGSEWSELAVDANKVFDNTTADDGTFTIPAPSTALAEGVYRLAASISLDDGSTYTAVAQVFTLTIDTTAPDKQPNTPVIKTGTDDTGSSQTDGITSTESIVITHATALATGEEQFTCYLNGAQVSTHYQSRDCTIALPQDGTHTITTTITDNAGNESPHSDPLTLTLDSTDPDITIIRLFDTDTTIDTNTRFIAVAADQTTVVFKVVEETKAACSARTSDASTAYAAGTQFDPSDTSTDGYCFVATDTAGNRATFHTDDAIEGVGSFAIQGGTTEASTVYTTSGTKTITGISAPEAKVLIKLADATDDPTTYTTTDLQSTSFATTSFDIPTGETSFSESLSISTSDNGKKVIGWIWTDAADQTTATPAITLTTLTVDNTAPTITAGTITSDNSDPTFAKQGDTITATFTVSEALQTQTTTINTVAATCSASSNTYTCTATLTNDATEGAAVVTTTAVDKAGNRTTKTTTDSTITVDATAPTLTITALPREHFKANDRLSFTLTLTDTNQIRQGTYTFTATGATLQTCTITVPATSNTESTTCTFTTTSATDGTPVTLTIPTLTDTPGNSRASYTTTLGYVDTQAPTIDEIISQDAKTKKFTFSLAVTHNQHASNTNPETLTPVFSGDCEDRITADPTWTGTTTGTYKTTATAKAGTYKTCTIALTDEAGNTSLTQTFDEFKVKGSGGVASIGGAVRGMIQGIGDFLSGSEGGQQQNTAPTAPTFSDAPIESVLSSIETVDLSVATETADLSVGTGDLTVGSVGEEVRTLQKLLNSLGFTVATTGPGSPGEETTYFGPATQRALIRYQEANGITPALGYYGPLTRERMQQQLVGQQRSQEQEDTTAVSVQGPQLPFSVTSLENETVVENVEEVAASVETPDPSVLTRDLTIGSVGEDVRSLQRLLNSLGFTIATSGPGSPGEETTYFGPATQRALIRYQQANGITPALGYFGPLTRERMQQQGSSQRSQSRQQQSPVETEEVRSFTESVEQEEEQSQQQQPVSQIQEVRSFTEVAEQEEEVEDYEPITTPLFRVRGPSSLGAPNF